MPLPETTRWILPTRVSASSIWSDRRANTAPLAPVTPTTTLFLPEERLGGMSRDVIRRSERSQGIGAGRRGTFALTRPFPRG